MAAIHRTATTASMMGYCMEIGCPHERHRPRSTSHETTGTLSRHAIRRPQRGQVEGGWNSERCFLSSLASRRIQTLRKLPTQSPRSPAPTSRIGSATTRHLVEQDTRRYRDVEGLGALCQRDRHPLRGDGVELRADSRPLVSDDNGNGSVHPSRSSLSPPPVERPLQGHTIRGARPQRHAVFPRPGDEASVVERHDGVAEGRAHGRPQRLGAGRIGRAPQHHRARGSERVRRTDQRADVPGILYAVDHQRHRPRGRREVARRPAPRLDDGDDTLRRFGVGQLSQDASADFLHSDGVPFELRDERRTARGACQLRGDQGPRERDAGGDRLFHEPYALDQGEAAPAARLAALEITYRRLQITGDESPRAFPAAAEHSICEEARDGRYVKIALTIAGSDSGGGAGIQADLKTFHQFGVFGTSVITAVTAQNTLGVRAWEPVPVALVARQLDALADDLPPAAVKSGMLGSAALVDAVADGIARRRLPHYVLDPVMVATSGDRLLDRAAERLILRPLVPAAPLGTPNLDEAAVLLGGSVRGPDDMERAGRALVQLGARAALVKGGHLAGDVVVDVLIAEGIARRFTRPRVETTSTHGTGCTLSAAVAAGLALGRPLERAVEDALDFVHRAIAAAPGLGQGHGPLNHFVPAPPRPPTDGL